MLEWGDALVKELAARRCIIFFGAGASAGCTSASGKKPPRWAELLTELCKKIRNNDSERALAEGLIASKNYLDAAEIIREALDHADYVDAMRQIFDTPRFSPSDIHKAILAIDPKIVITTNFDTIYDLHCQTGGAYEGYNVFKQTDTHLVSQLRSPIRCIIKAHGSITDPDSMVLTRSEYFSARQRAPHFFRVLDALFLTHTILFIGYGLSDPDILLTLENANIAAPSSHRHYFVTERGTPAIIKKSYEKTYNIHFLEFEPGNFTELGMALNSLASRVDLLREENPAI